MAATLAVLAVITVAGVHGSAEAAATVTYSATQTIPVPPASGFAGSGGGDGWAVALSPTEVFNVFHHAGRLTVACHRQADAAECWSPRTITDPGGSAFATSGQPGLWLAQATGRLYVYATRAGDATGGVVCVDTVAAAGSDDPFCGFTALTAAGEADLGSGISAISAPAPVGGHWYAFNYVPGSGISGSRNKLLCFDLSALSACGSQPYAIAFAGTTVNDGAYPAPAVTAIGGRVVVPVSTDTGQQLACFDAGRSATCSGSWPVALAASYTSSYGAAYPMLDARGAVTGLCLPTGDDPCYDTNGATAATPPGMRDAVTASSGWNGAAVTVGPRVYVPNGNAGAVDCYDYATAATCPNFPKTLGGLALLYTVNPDPQRPTCLWVNADGGAAQIQNFDAYTGGACGQGPIRVLARSFVVDSTACRPASYTSLQVTSPARSSYAGGSVTFQDADAAAIPGLPERPIDASGTVGLTGLNLSTALGLPQFLITLAGSAGPPTAVTVKLTWTGVDDPACVKPGTVTTGGGTPADDSCPDVYFLGAAGSGQSTSTGDRDLGYGAQIRSVRDRLRADLPAKRRNVEYHPLPYTAADVGLLGYAPGVYFDSISTGVALASAKIRLVRTLCPHEHIVLAGYSQGAMVIHRVLLDLVARRDTATIAHLDGVILVADGDRVRGDNTTDWGDARSAGQGIGQFLPAISGSTNRKLPDYLRDRVHRVCNWRDPVCDDIIPPGRDLPARLFIHLGYTNTPPLRKAVDAVAGEVRTTPAPSASLSSLTARTGRPYRGRLTADVDPDFDLQWRLVSPSTLPPGWTLDRSGVVAGTTSYTGTWSARVEVRAVILGVTSEWIPATARWTVTR